MTINSATFSPFSSFSSAAPASATPSAATSGTSGSTSSGGVDSLSGSGSVYGLSTDDFMKLFLAQLQNQDPTKPMDDSQMLNELSQMTQVQTLQQVQQALQGSQLAQSSALIGKNVTGMDVNGTAVNGVVTSVTQSTDAGLVLQVGTQYIKPDSVTAVTNPVASGTTGTTTP
jgi:flagellar basal-body rod modification protein FlgD